MEIYIITYTYIDNEAINLFDSKTRCFSTLEKAQKRLKTFKKEEIAKCKSENSEYVIMNDEDNIFSIEINRRLYHDAFIRKRTLDKE